MADDQGKLAGLCDLSRTFFVIWTTTTWTLPGNLAICLGPDIDYILMAVPGGETYIVAKELAESVAKAAGIESYETLATLKGTEFELMTARHPFFDRTSVILNGDHVTLEAGTGCVHTAPGHGMDDFIICRKYDASGRTNIGVIVPVDAAGHMTEEAGPFAGLFYAKANDAILEALTQSGMLLAKTEFVHSYPHCWRCKKPILYRATDQWFCSVDAIKDAAVAAVRGVKWLPEWGEERMVAMVRERADWCISRQRNWGLPIPVFYCKDCGKPVCTDETIAAVSKAFGEHGSNIWFDEKAKLLPDGFTCPHCGGRHFTRETDTLDGWFDSGSTHFASLRHDDPQNWPADLYLEGADQYRGWFQSSLLTSIATTGRAPYKGVLTHGWTVDGEGKAMHKSLGNAILPDQIIPKYGADLLRLWAASADYRADMRCSDAIFKQLSDQYLKIRNTARYILGNLDGFDPDAPVAYDDLQPLDKWALHRLNALIGTVRDAYENYEFHVISHAIHRFCVIDMSTFYLDIIKDRLYCEEREGVLRRGAQTAIYYILDAMVRMLAPILAFTAEEIWAAMRHDASCAAESVLFNDMPSVRPEWQLPPEDEDAWNALRALRLDVNRTLEAARAAKTIGKALDAQVTLYVSDEAKPVLAKLEGLDLRQLFLVSAVHVVEGTGEGTPGENVPGVTVAAAPADGEKCPRCWNRCEDLGADPEYPELCPRCAAVVRKMQQ